MHARPARGVTLIDLSVATAVIGVLASMALPSYQTQLARAHRSEAIAALTQLEAAQERFRALHGSYALRLSALQGVPVAGNRYDIALATAHASGYIARAHARDGSASDAGCAELTLSVADGVAAHGPSERCWNR